MQSRLSKSLYLGLAVLSFGAVAAVSTTANAASKAKVTSNTTLKTDATTRNVAATGTNALYSKPGTVKGAKVVASKATMAKLANSKKSTDYFRVYRVATTNKKSVYYKVVSMNGKYRGYIYGGKDASTFAGGLTSAATMTDAALPTDTIATFAKPGRGNVTWNAPKYTQYKASKNVADTTPFAKDQLKITKAATKTREGSLYYYVEDAKNPSVNGWIFSGAIKTVSSQEIAAQNGITLNYINKVTNTTISNKVVAMPTGTTDSATNDQAKKLATDNVPAGYSAPELSSTDKVAKGGSVIVYVTPNADAQLTLTPKVYNNDVEADAQTLLTAHWATPEVTATLTKDTFFKKAGGSVATGDEIVNQLKTDKLDSFVLISTKAANSNGSKVAYQYTLNNATEGIYGKTSTVYYKVVKGLVTPTTSTGAFTPGK